MLLHFKEKLRKIVENTTVEPVMLLSGACYWSMQTFMEIVQMHKICKVALNYSEEICGNLSAHPEENILVEKEYSMFVFQNSIVLSIIPLIVVIFLGAWSDKYGRKIPLLLCSLSHALWSGGYFLNSWQASWPMEIIYFLTIFEVLGGSAQGLISSSVAYISDITAPEDRTSRVSTAVSFFYFGGPIGNFIGAMAIQGVGIDLALAIVFTIHVTVFLYIAYYIKESHGPFAVLRSGQDEPNEKETINKEDVTVCKMVRDFFNWRRLIETFKTACRSRDGYNRAILFAVIISNMIRRTARGFFMYMFVRRSLGWEAAIYSYWTSYRTLIAASGSMILVPILAKLVSITDPMLIVIGSLSLVGEYSCYGFVSGAATAVFMWLGPPAGLISNASIIAQKSIATKLVSPTEKGRVSALLSATQSLMPVVGYAMYTPIYHSTQETFPEAQFFFAASLATIIVVIFLVIHITNITQAMKEADIEQKKEVSREKSNQETLKTKPSFESPSKTDEIPPCIKAVKDNNTCDSKSIEFNSQSLGNNKIENSQVRSQCSTCKPVNKSSETGELHSNVIHLDEIKEKACYENKITDGEILQSENVCERRHIRESSSTHSLQSNGPER